MIKLNEFKSELVKKDSEIFKITNQFSNDIERTRHDGSLEVLPYTVGCKVIKFTPEQIEANKAAAELKVKELEEQREKEIEIIVQSGYNLIQQTENQAVQAISDTTPLPNERDRAIMEKYQEEHPAMDIDSKMDLLNTLQYEANHETSNARAYYFLANRLLEKNISVIEILDQSYDNIFKDHVAALDMLEQVNEAGNMFKAGVLVYKYERLGDQLSMMDRIHIKNEVDRLGYIDMLHQ